MDDRIAQLTQQMKAQSDLLASVNARCRVLEAAVFAFAATHPDKRSFLAELDRRVENDIVTDLYKSYLPEVADCFAKHRTRVTREIHAACSQGLPAPQGPE